MPISDSFYRVINTAVAENCRRLVHSKFSNELKSLLTEKEELELFALLKDISSLSVSFKDGLAEYTPGLIIENKPSFALTDMTDQQYELLGNIDISKLPLLLRARIANIYWNEKRIFEKAEEAIASYYELYKSLYDIERWSPCVGYIKHAINMAKRLNKNDIANNYVTELYNTVIAVQGKDPLYFSTTVIEYLLTFDTIDFEPLLDILSSIIETTDTPKKKEESYNLIITIYKKKKDSQGEKQSKLQLAKYYTDSVDVTSDISSLYISQENLKKAIHLFNELGRREDATESIARLQEVQRNILENLPSIHFENDDSHLLELLYSSLRGLSFEQALIKLIQMVPVFKKDDLKKAVLDAHKTNLFNGLIKEEEIISETGNTQGIIPSLDPTEPEKDTKVLELHMHREALTREQFCGELLRCGLIYIKKNYCFEKEDLAFLFTENPIIPEDRTNVMLSAIFHGINGEFYEALHILAPQTENLLRSITSIHGDSAVKLKDDDSMEFKLLTSVFDSQKLWDCYDNDILFLLKGLMNEKAGANIRNEIAHGIMSPESGNSSVSVYFFCLVLKIIHEPSLMATVASEH